MKKHYRNEDDCLNCGTILEGKFCHNCGQENLQIKESFGHMINHAVSDYFHFDHQFFHTLKPLLFKPGTLTNEYMAGRRTQYLHPVKMYIFISLVFFFFYMKDNKNEPVKFNETDKTEEGIIYSTKTGKAKGPVADTVKNKNNAEESLVLFGIDVNDKKTYKDYLADQQKLPAGERDNFLERYLKKKSYDWKSNGKGAKSMFAEAFKHNVPKMMFILLPLFALILKVAFWKNRKFYVEHLIYSFHLHCFLFLFLALTFVLAFILPQSWEDVNDWVNIFAFFYINWYIYKSLKAVYQRSRWRTISKMLGIGIMYMLALSTCFLIVAAVTALTTV